MKRTTGGRLSTRSGDPSDGGAKIGVPELPAPQSGLPKWLEYAEAQGIDVPEDIRDDKAAIRSLVDDK
jgi:hypothetical protein